MSIQAILNELTGPQLVAVYNGLSEESVKRFATRDAGIKRIVKEFKASDITEWIEEEKRAFGGVEGQENSNKVEKKKKVKKAKKTSPTGRTRKTLNNDAQLRYTNKAQRKVHSECWREMRAIMENHQEETGEDPTVMEVVDAMIDNGWMAQRSKVHVSNPVKFLRLYICGAIRVNIFDTV